jgi:spermidine synthase
LVLFAALIFFPFGIMREKFIPISIRPFADASTHIRAIREGIVETSVYLENAGEYRLFTNGFSMSATTPLARRYMSLFADLPLGMRPQIRSALLISYGVGVTAKTLTNARQLTSIDVVDISRDILDLGEIVWPGDANPLRDPRVTVHVEDGRFFLAATPKRFDLITGEPPPPRTPGAVNIYTREFFQLVYDHLNDGGMATYWCGRPSNPGTDIDTVIKAFCAVFDDCSMWNATPFDDAGRQPEIGRHGVAGTVHLAVATRSCGVTPRHRLRPEQIGATFLGVPAICSS